MTAYFAILKDSFREAIASRVLLISLIGLVVVLLLLAPFRLQYNQSTTLRRSEVTDPTRLLTELASENENKSAAAKHLWSILKDDEKNGLSELLPDKNAKSVSQPGRRRNSQKRILVERLNRVLEHEDFYRKEAWNDIRPSDDLQQLLDQEQLNEQQAQRRNLLLFSSAFQRSISITDSSAIYVMYGTVEVFGPIPLTPTEFEPVFREFTIGIVAVFLGFFGVFGTLLITAGIIPRTFEPGEITLLASKPIRRSGLFLTKFLGGCIFTLLFAIVLVVGVWLILGMRMDSWNHRLLWCIPIYVFLFMIYYSVSAVCGVIWKNSIVSLTAVVLFWLFIVVVGITHENLNRSMIQERGIREIVVAGEDILTVDGQQQTWLWNPALESWETVFAPPSNRVNDFLRRFGSANQVRFAPAYDAQQDRILAIQANQSPFGGMGSPELIVGTSENDWDRTSLGRIPSITTVMLQSTDGLFLLLSQDQILRFDDRPERQEDSLSKGGLLNLFLGQKANGFQPVHPKEYTKLAQNFTACLVPDSHALLTYSAGNLSRFEMVEDNYQQTQNVTVESSLVATVAATDQIGILFFRDGKVSTFDPITLEMKDSRTEYSGVVPKRSEVSPDSNYIAVLTHDETILIFDVQTEKFMEWQPSENGTCSAMTFNSEGHLLLSDGRLAVHQYDLSTKKRLTSWAQQETRVYAFYDYVVNPLWKLLPRPGQLDRFAKWTLDGDQEVLAGEGDGPPRPPQPDNLLQDRDRFSPSQVIIKNGLFIAVLLALGCFYVQRNDF
ncbi:MAG: ABC transporter permease [Fuerstiella sp.]